MTGETGEIDDCGLMIDDYCESGINLQSAICKSALNNPQSAI
jgi:hypothetical protein